MDVLLLIINNSELLKQNLCDQTSCKITEFFFKRKQPQRNNLYTSW